MSRSLEYLDEAIEEAEGAARWYAERSSSAATGFADEIDTAIAAIELKPGRVRLWTFARAAAEPRDVWDENLVTLARALA